MRLTVLLRITLMSIISAIGVVEFKRPVLADNCDSLVAEIIAKEGGIIERRTDAQVILMRHPLAGHLSVGCPLGTFQTPDLSIGFDSANLPAAFYDLVARAGAIVTRAPRDTIRRVRSAAKRRHCAQRLSLLSHLLLASNSNFRRSRETEAVRQSRSIDEFGDGAQSLSWEAYFTALWQRPEPEPIGLIGARRHGLDHPDFLVGQECGVADAAPLGGRT
jgi:hypothetical protein